VLTFSLRRVEREEKKKKKAEELAQKKLLMEERRAEKEGYYRCFCCFRGVAVVRLRCGNGL